jgi:hypothetical protein
MKHWSYACEIWFAGTSFYMKYRMHDNHSENRDREKMLGYVWQI